MFGGIASKLSILSRKSDVIPNALFPNYAGDSDITSLVSNNAYFQITGISQPITLKLSWAENEVSVYYFVTNSLGILANEWAPNLTPISNDGTFQVSNNQYVVIGAINSADIQTNISVLNNSNSDTLLTTVIITIVS
jgi:hypothetical protein